MGYGQMGGAGMPAGGMGAPMSAPPAGAVPGGMGGMGAGYANASQMPELAPAPDAPPPGVEGSDPIISALKTLQTLSAAMDNQGNPQAEAFKSHLMGILDTLSAGGTDMPMGDEQAAQPAFDPFQSPDARPKNEPTGMGEMEMMAKKEAKPLV